MSPSYSTSGLESQTTSIPAASADPDYYRESMRKGSVSFTLAARLFDAEQQAAVQRLYAWCRYCDDQIDLAPSQAEAGRRLDDMRAQTESALRGEPAAHPAFAGLQEVARDYGIPAHYAQELLNGFEMDVFHRRVRSLAELELYCHRVAGVVGLMMCHIMGLSDERALAYADAAGRALQLTNIARDVREDLASGRLYLPLSWFKEQDLSPPQGLDDFDPEAVYPVVMRLLGHAESKYRLARLGLPYLALRPALAVSAALKVYGGIGTAIRRQGPQALAGRTVIPGRRKLGLAAAGCAQVLAQLAPRLRSPWQGSVIREVRHFEI